MLDLGFTQSPYEPLLFMTITDKATTLLLVDVDGIIIMGTHSDMIHKLQSSLQATFHMKDLDPLTYFLGLEVQQLRKWLFLHQCKYVTNLIDLAGLQGATLVDTPLEVNVKLRKDDEDLLFYPTYYRHLVGSLIYLTITRPDISYVVNVVSQFMTAPRHSHLVATKRIIPYILNSPILDCFSYWHTTYTLCLF